MIFLMQSKNTTISPASSSTYLHPQGTRALAAARLALSLMCLLSFGACGDDAGAGGGDAQHALMDVQGTVGTYSLDLRDVQVRFIADGGMDRLSQDRLPISGLVLSLNLAGQFTVGTHVLDENASENASTHFYDHDMGVSWYAASSGAGYSPITFEVTRSDAEELAGRLSAVLLGVGSEGTLNTYSTTDTLSANLQVRLHSFGSNQNQYGYERPTSGCDDCGEEGTGEAVGSCTYEATCFDILQGDFDVEMERCAGGAERGRWSSSSCDRSPYDAHCYGAIDRDTGHTFDAHSHSDLVCSDPSDSFAQICMNQGGRFEGNDCP